MMKLSRKLDKKEHLILLMLSVACLLVPPKSQNELGGFLLCSEIGTGQVMLL